MNIWTRMFSSARSPSLQVRPAGLVKDEDGWYYEESCQVSGSRLTIRVEQDRPGDWYAHDSGCEVDGIDDPERADDVERFFGGSFRWLELELDDGGSGNCGTVTVVGTFLDDAGCEQRVPIGRLENKLVRQLRGEEISRMWAKICALGFPLHGNRRGYRVCFDLMIELDEGLFE